MSRRSRFRYVTRAGSKGRWHDERSAAIQAAVNAGHGHREPYVGAPAFLDVFVSIEEQRL